MHLKNKKQVSENLPPILMLTGALQKEIVINKTYIQLIQKEGGLTCFGLHQGHLTQSEPSNSFDTYDRL